MTNYIEIHARNSGGLAGTGIIARIWQNFGVRRAVSQMSSFDDHLLRDIGVSRADVQWAAGLPLTVNAALALEERSIQARRKA